MLVAFCLYRTEITNRNMVDRPDRDRFPIFVGPGHVSSQESGKFKCTVVVLVVRKVMKVVYKGIELIGYFDEIC